MTTDRELLEAAALAAGMGPLIWGEFNPETPLVSGAAIRWNPITDDGDALRLAVRLRITIECWPVEDGISGKVEWRGTTERDANLCILVGAEISEVRRAIVRAAAGITPG